MPQNMRDIANALSQSQTGVTSDIIKDLIKLNSGKQKSYNDKFLRYRQESVPILSKPRGDGVIDVRIPNDFVGDIVDTKVGYFGQGISVKLDKTVYDSDTEFESDDEVIQAFEKDNNTDDLNAETVKDAAICGLAARLLYVDKEGKARVMLVPAYETIFIYDRSLDEVQFALRYYTITVIERNTEYQRYRIEWYDSKNITFYQEQQNGDYALDTSESINPLPHQFTGIPLIPFPNNSELLGDCDKVIHHIDAYDSTLSDAVTEIQRFRMAYLRLKGSLADDETVRNLAKKNIIALEENGEIDWLIKELPLDAILNFENKIAELIMRFGKSTDFGDASFAAGMPVMAYKLKMFALEAKCQTMEHKFRKALYEMYRLLCDFWRTMSIGDVDANDLEFVFVRNLPDNIDAEVKNLQAMATPVSKKTMYSITSFIDDPEAEMEQIKLETEDEESYVSDSSVQDEETMQSAVIPAQPVEEGAVKEDA